MDGFTLLDEISARFMTMRPLVAVVVTGHSDVESAVRAMRSNAVDFLGKPVTAQDLSAVLRRASARWAQQIGQFQLMALARAGQNAVLAGDAASELAGDVARHSR